MRGLADIGDMVTGARIDRLAAWPHFTVHAPEAEIKRGKGECVVCLSACVRALCCIGTVVIVLHTYSQSLTASHAVRTLLTSSSCALFSPSIHFVRLVLSVPSSHLLSPARPSADHFPQWRRPDRPTPNPLPPRPRPKVKIPSIVLAARWTLVTCTRQRLRLRTQVD